MEMRDNEAKIIDKGVTKVVLFTQPVKNVIISMDVRKQRSILIIVKFLLDPTQIS